MSGFLYLYMSLLTEELDNWELPQWALESADPLWVDIKEELSGIAEKSPGSILPPYFQLWYGVVAPGYMPRKVSYAFVPCSLQSANFETIRDVDNYPDINLTTSVVYNKLKKMWPDREIVFELELY